MYVRGLNIRFTQRGKHGMKEPTAGEVSALHRYHDLSAKKSISNQAELYDLAHESRNHTMELGPLVMQRFSRTSNTLLA
jgi:hypothetical protein